MKKPSAIFMILTGMLLSPLLFSADRTPAEQVLANKIFSVNVNGATAENVVRMIAQKAGVGVQIEGDLSKRVNYSFSNTTLQNAMTVMSSDVGFDYSLRDGVLYVSGKSGKAKSAGFSQNVNLIELSYTDAEEMATKLKTIVGENEEIHVDKKQNALIIVGSEASFQKAKKFVAFFDRMPSQIMIEAQIVATNDNFSREIGFMGGDLTDTAMSNTNAKATGFSNPSFSTPVGAVRYKIGAVKGRALEMRLLAAETSGDAKVISRPKVVTINNTRALINSGLVFNVKTLSATTTSGGASTDSGTATAATTNIAGGIERLEAGLTLGVLPTIVDKNLVRLIVDVNNSEPDKEIEIDGIPSISTNSANTSVIVEDGGTAVIAGLIKNSKSHARSGVPFLSDIPILGMLFRTDGETTRNNELMIFITPRVLEKPKLAN